MLIQPEGIAGLILVIVLGFVSLAFFLSGLYQRYRLIRLGRGEDRFNHLLRRLAALIFLVFGQWTLLKSATRSDRAGITHFFIFWGGIAFVFGYVFFPFGSAFNENFAVKVLGQKFAAGLSFAIDVLSALALIAAVWGLVRRFIVRPPRQTASMAWLYFSLTILVLLLGYFSLEAFRVMGDETASALQFPVGAPLARTMAGLGLTGNQVQAWHDALWWFEFAVIVAFLIHSRYSEHMHAIAAPLNLFFKSLEPKGELKPVDMKTARVLATATLTGLTWKELLDGLTCTECGRCQMNCPAYLSGKVLNPKEIIGKMRKQLLGGRRYRNHVVFGETGEGISEQAVWDCTTCGACQQQCPVAIEHVFSLIDFRRQLVERGIVSRSIRNTLENMYTLGNPWGQSQTARTDLVRELRLPLVQEAGAGDFLYWIGCSSVYDERARHIARAVAALMDRAGVKLAVLGAEEKCCGDPARRMGEEGLFQQRASANTEILKKYNVRRIIVHCPHCYNTLKNEYHLLGAGFEVIHHSELILELLQAGRIKPHRPLDFKLTFHDPCYLGRYNNLYGALRQVIKANRGIKLVEMKHNREGSLCCGAGGGHFWMAEGRGSRMENMRLEQAQETGAQVIATACPYCVVMLDTAAATRSDSRIKVVDIAELVMEAAFEPAYCVK